MHNVLAYIMRGHVQAILVATALMFLSVRLDLLSLLAGAVFGLVSLRLGMKEGLIVTVATAVAVAILSHFAFGMAGLGLTRVVILGLPILLLSMVLRQTASLAAMMQAAGVIGFLIVLIIIGLGEQFETAWRSHLDQFVRPTLEMASKQSGGPITSVEVDKFIDLMTTMRSGLVASVMVSTLTLTMLLARWWQAILYNPGGFQKEFHGIRLGKTSAAITAGLMVLALVTKGAVGSVALNLLSVAFLLYVFQGLVLGHSLVALTGAGRGWLIGLYVMVIIGLIALPLLLMLPVFAGLLDTWINFRARVAKQA